MKILIAALLFAQPFICMADEMQNLLDKLNELSSKASCSVNEECSSLTLGWADCSISNYEFAISTKDKELLSNTLQTAKRYENLWRKAVMSNEIPKDCRVQKLSKSECKAGKCVLVGPQVAPEEPPQIDPNLSKRILSQ